MRLLLVATLLSACSKPADTAAPPAGDSAPPPADTSFTLVVIPDVQYYTLGYEAVLDDMIDWIVDEAEERDIAFAVQEGDITHENSEVEWFNAEDSLRRMDDRVPYALCVGNHDMSDGDTSLFNGAFSRARQALLPGFGDTMDPALMDNAWHQFTAAGVDWLVLSLTYDPPEDVLDWAAGVVEDHPDERVIVLTHAYLLPSGERSSVGDRIWEAVVAPHQNVTLVLNGHYIDGEAAHLVSEDDAGRPVAQVFANYQTLPIGGEGRIRLMEIRTDVGEIRVQTYGAPFDVWVTDEANDFLLEGLDLGPL